MLYGLGPNPEVRSNVEAGVNYPMTTGTGFLDIVNLLLTVLFAFIYLWNCACWVRTIPLACLDKIIRLIMILV